LGVSKQSSCISLLNQVVAPIFISKKLYHSIKATTYRATCLSFCGCSFVQHLLSGLFELAPSLNVKLLIFLGYSCCSSSIAAVLSNNINSLTVIVWVIDVLLLSFLG
jgi:hypothetical protein